MRQLQDPDKFGEPTQEDDHQLYYNATKRTYDELKKEWETLSKTVDNTQVKRRETIQ